MSLWQQLFSDWVGILSAFTVFFVLGMAVYIGTYVYRHLDDKQP